MNEKLNDQVLKMYVATANDWKIGASALVAYVLVVSSMLVLAPRSIANNDNLLTGGKRIIDDLASAIRAVSTGAALVGVGTGAFLKKFSLGKPDRIETGNKMITNSIWAWVMVNGLLLILRFFGSYFGIDGIDDEFDGGMPN